MVTPSARDGNYYPIMHFATREHTVILTMSYETRATAGGPAGHHTEQWALTAHSGSRTSTASSRHTEKQGVSLLPRGDARSLRAVAKWRAREEHAPGYDPDLRVEINGCASRSSPTSTPSRTREAARRHTQDRAFIEHELAAPGGSGTGRRRDHPPRADAPIDRTPLRSQPLQRGVRVEPPGPHQAVPTDVVGPRAHARPCRRRDRSDSGALQPRRRRRGGKRKASLQPGALHRDRRRATQTRRRRRPVNAPEHLAGTNEPPSDPDDAVEANTSTD